MGSAASTIRTATAIRGLNDKRYLLSEDEVREDEVGDRAQRRSIKYCVEHVYKDAPVNIQGLTTPGHHRQAALITFDAEADEASGASPLRQRRYPTSCLVDVGGKVTITAGEKTKHTIHVEDVARLRSPPLEIDAPSPTRHGRGVTLVWNEPRELATLVDKYETQYRRLGTSWERLATCDVLRGEDRTATADGLVPNQTYEFRARAKNAVGWGAWSKSAALRTNPAPPDAPLPPFAPTVLPEAIFLCWRPPSATHGSAVRGYKLRMRRPQDEEHWRTLYEGPLTRYLVCGLEAAQTYSFSVAASNSVGASKYSDTTSFRTPTARNANDGYAPPQNATLLRMGDLWLECWDPQLETVFYFNRVTAARVAEPPDAWLEQRRDAVAGGGLSLVTDEATKFRLKRFHFMKSLWPSSRARNPRLVDGKLPLMVRRSRICEDSLAVIRTTPAAEFRAKLRVEYEGERGIDSGGLTKDWFLQLSKELQSRFFRPTAKHELELKDAAPVDDVRALGRFIAKALHDQQCVDLPLSGSLYNILRGVVGDDDDVGVADLDADDAGESNRRVLDAVLREVEDLDPEFHKSLVWILEHDPSDLCLTFAVDDDKGTEIDLVDSGRQTDVTQSNKTRYVFLVSRWRVRYRVQLEIDALLLGCADLGVTPDRLGKFTSSELTLLLNGRKDIDVDEIRAFAAHQGDGFPLDHVVALWFWQFMFEADSTDRESVLVFATGSHRVPLDGFEPPLTLCLDCERVDALPTAHTCFNQLVLPSYSSYDVLRRQLRLAIANADTFELT